MKHLLTLAGIAAFLSAIYLWGGGISPSLNALVTQVKRATAADSAEFQIALAKNETRSLENEKRKADIDKKILEIQLGREKLEHEKELVVMKKLVSSLKKAGGSKVSDLDKLSEKVRKKRIVFLNQELTLDEGYQQLIKLQKDYDTQNRILERKAMLITRLEAYAKQLSTIRENLLEKIEKLEIKKKELEMEQRIAIVEAKGNQMAASAQGRYLGSIGENLKTMQNAIDEAHAQSVIAQEELAKAMLLNPEDSSNTLSLDSLFE